MKKIIITILTIITLGLAVFYYNLNQKKERYNYTYTKEIDNAFQLISQKKYEEARAIYDNIKTENMNIMNTIEFKKSQLLLSENKLPEAIEALKNISEKEGILLQIRSKAIENIYLAYYYNPNDTTFNEIFNKGDSFSRFATNTKNKDESLLNMARYATEDLYPSAILLANVCKENIRNRKGDETYYKSCKDAIDAELSILSNVSEGLRSHESLILVDKATMSWAAYNKNLESGNNVKYYFEEAIKETSSKKEYTRLAYVKYNYILFLNESEGIKSSSSKIIIERTNELVDYLKAGTDIYFKDYVVNDFKKNSKRVEIFSYNEYLKNMSK